MSGSLLKVRDWAPMDFQYENLKLYLCDLGFSEHSVWVRRESVSKGNILRASTVTERK